MSKDIQAIVQEKLRLAGQKAALRITVKESREKQVPGLDDEFAKDTGEADTLTELKAKLRERLLKEDEEEARGELKRDLMKELLKRNTFAVAPPFSSIARPPKRPTSPSGLASIAFAPK